MTVLMAEVEALRGASAATYNTAYQRAQKTAAKKYQLQKCAAGVMEKEIITWRDRQRGQARGVASHELKETSRT